MRNCAKERDLSMTSESVFPTPIDYLVFIQTPIPPSNTTSTEVEQSVPTVPMIVLTSTEDAQNSLIPPTTTQSVTSSNS